MRVVFPMLRPCVQIVSQILKELKLEPFTIKLNHRRLLDAMLAVAGVPAQKFRCGSASETNGNPSYRCHQTFLHTVK